MQRQRQTTSGGASGGLDLSSASAERCLLMDYRPPPGTYDEFLSSEGHARPTWEAFTAQLLRLGSETVRRRWTHSQRLIYENGVAYSPHGDAHQRPRPWTLDPLPVLLHRDEWRAVSEGLVQRGQLLERTLQDLFGPQELVRTGVIPQDLLYSHPGYSIPLRRGPSSKPSAAPSRMLHFYAADLGRSPDGSWWVLADRTEAPSGIGFALENRIVVSRMLPEPFRDCRVQRLAGFFARLRETLKSIAPEASANPRVAILSQGPGRPNYFEDAYLARYLGYTLVEGEDLTVRNRRLWLKTLEGLAPIDVLLRRPNTEDCDPLELGGSSPSGVAGLAQTAHGGGLAMANALGSGIVESPVFMAYLPKLCRELLGQDLKLPGVATWWCGDPNSLEFVLENLDRLILKRAFRQRGEESLVASELRDASNESLAERVRRNPRSYIAQERVERSSAPLWFDNQVEASRLALRAFAVADGSGYYVMEGALARTTRQLEPLETSIVSGEGSKDVWVVGDEPVDPITLLPDDNEPVDLIRVGAELPSRVADNSYWLGRHLERADAKGRLLRTVANRLAGERDPRELPELPPLIRALAVQGQIEPGYAVEELRNRLPLVEQALQEQTLNRQQPGSLTSTVDSVFALASKVRDRLSADAWRIVLRVRDTGLVSGDPHFDLTDLINATDELIFDLAAFGGMVIEGMTRTQFYRFLDIGRRIERAIQLVDLLSASLIESNPTGRSLLEALLETSNSLMTYRSRYRANLQFAAALDLLVTDESNPRSLAFQLQTLERHVGKLPNPEQATGVAPELRLAMSMAHAVRMADLSALVESHEMGEQDPLAGLFDQLARELPALSDAISLKYLVHAGTPRQLSPM